VNHLRLELAIGRSAWPFLNPSRFSCVEMKACVYDYNHDYVSMVVVEEEDYSLIVLMIL
jgi:hypothetical protein